MQSPVKPGAWIMITLWQGCFFYIHQQDRRVPLNKGRGGALKCRLDMTKIVFSEWPSIGTGCLGEWWGSLPWRYSRAVGWWHWGMWAVGTVGWVRLGELRGLFQTSWFSDSILRFEIPNKSSKRLQQKVTCYFHCKIKERADYWSAPRLQQRTGMIYLFHLFSAQVTEANRQRKPAFMGQSSSLHSQTKLGDGSTPVVTPKGKEISLQPSTSSLRGSEIWE